jgi:hypothetical protein
MGMRAEDLQPSHQRTELRLDRGVNRRVPPAELSDRREPDNVAKTGRKQVVLDYQTLWKAGFGGTGDIRIDRREVATYRVSLSRGGCETRVRRR